MHQTLNELALVSKFCTSIRFLASKSISIGKDGAGQTKVQGLRHKAYPA